MFVYATGHAVRGEKLKFVLNSTTGLQFALEQTCLDLIEASDSQCTVVQVNDLETGSNALTSIED